MLPRVFVVTLNWNGREWLHDCLVSVFAMDYPNYQVVMVDNGSTDGSVEFVRQQFPSAHIVGTGSNLGYARGFNAGLEYAAARGADFFLIMNNDTMVDRGALSALAETAQTREKAGFVTGKIYLYDRPDTFQTVGKREDPITWNGHHIGWLEKDIGQYESVEERVFVDDVMTLVDRRLYDEIGGYDPQFFLQCEEFDWQARAKKRGWRFYYTPKARLWHRVGMSMGGRGSSVGCYFNARNAIVVRARHTGPARFLRYYAHTCFQVLNSFLRGLVQLNGAKLRPRLATLLGFCAGTLWLVHRQPATRVPWIIVKLR